MSNSINVTRVDVDVAHEVWSTSPHATVFTEPGLIDRFVKKVTWWMASKGNTPFVLWPVFEGSGDHPMLPPFSYFAGPIWSKEAWARSNTSKLSDSLSFYEKIVEAVLEVHEGLLFELHPGLLDVRFFDWWAYEAKTRTPFCIQPRYTAQIGGLQTKSMDEIVTSFRELRRREIRKASSNQSLKTVSRVPLEVFETLRGTTLARQGTSVDEHEKNAMGLLFELVDEGRAHSLGVLDSASGEVVAATLVLDGVGVSNLVLNVANANYRNHGVGPLVISKSIETAKQRGSQIFDFNGANSPRRGDDKHSYGSDSVLYFRISNPANSKLADLSAGGPN